MRSRLVIATRESALALWQARHVQASLMRLHPGLQVDLLPMKTRGDRILDVPLAKVGGKGLFVKELEEALLAGRADLAVHSMKDVPMHLPEGLKLACILKRENPLDALVSPLYDTLESLPPGGRVGTSSLRRRCQLAAQRPDLEIVSLRGNVNTRLRKLDEGEYDAIILAASGLKRLGLSDRIRCCIDPAELLPACGQGALGIECREDDTELRDLLAPLRHERSEQCVLAERAFNRKLEGGCQVPIGGYAVWFDGHLEMEGLVGSLDGRQILRDRRTADATEAEQLGIALADSLLKQGAGTLLSALHEDRDASD